MKPIEVFKSYIPYYKRNLKVALPVMLSQLCVGIVQLVDSIMVGHLGTVELAAVAFASSVFAIGNCFAMGVLFGLTPLVGQAYVREQHDVCSRLFQNAFLLALISMVLVCVLLLAAMWLMPFMGQDAQVVELAQPYFFTLILSMIPQLLFPTCQKSTHS